jgi:hypothetical protein
VTAAYERIVDEFAFTQRTFGHLVSAYLLLTALSCVGILVLASVTRYYLVSGWSQVSDSLYLAIEFPTLCIPVWAIDQVNVQAASIISDVAELAGRISAEEQSNFSKYSLTLLRLSMSVGNRPCALKLLGKKLTSYDLLTALIVVLLMQGLSYLDLNVTNFAR